jgi:protein SCO1/2
MSENRIFSLIILLGAVTALSALVLFVAMPERAPRPVPEALDNVLLPEPRPLSDFSLNDTNGEPFNLASLQNSWHFLFFGYTHCPDICPTTLSTLRLTAKALEKSGDAKDSRFVFISVDPKRDSLDHLKQYVGYFHPDFLAATGEKAAIDALARQVGAIYMFDGDTEGDEYIVNHSATVVLIDPQGRWVARFNPPHSAAGIAEQFRAVRAYFIND